MIPFYPAGTGFVQGIVELLYDSPTSLLVAKQTDGSTVTDSNGVRHGAQLVSVQNITGQSIGVSINNDPTASNATAFWNNVAAGAGASSASTGAMNGKSKWRVLATTSAADTITAQYSIDNVTWFDVTIDNAGTLWTLATVVGHLSACRELPSFGANFVRLITVSAVTITAGYQNINV